MNKPNFEIFPLHDADKNLIERAGFADSEILVSGGTHESPRAGAFILDVVELSEGAAVGIIVKDTHGKYIQASNTMDRPGTSVLAIGESPGVELASVSAPQTPLPDAFRVEYVVRNGSAKFGVKAAMISCARKFDRRQTARPT
jgi:hypothetical protein